MGFDSLMAGVWPIEAYLTRCSMGIISNVGRLPWVRLLTSRLFLLVNKNPQISQAFIRLPCLLYDTNGLMSDERHLANMITPADKLNAVVHATFSSLGGAGAVAARVAQAQRHMGWTAELACLVDTPFPKWARRYPLLATAALADYYLVRKNRDEALFSLFRRQHHRATARQIVDFSGILHLHWLPGFLRPTTLFSAPLRAHKIVWSVQDMWPLTGGCHYANACQGFTMDCAACPQVRPAFQPWVEKAFHEKKAGLAGRHNLLIAVPSEWTRRLVQSSAMMRHLPSVVIPNPVDTRVFTPADKAASRARWGIGANRFVIGIGAADLRDERKQIRHTLTKLVAWLASSGLSRPMEIVVFGAGGPFRDMPQWVRFLGPSKNAAMLADWFNLMDVYVTLSRYETFGNTIAEAAACGTPTICATGSGMAEVVEPDVTGLHVNASAALPGAILSLMQNPSRLSEMGKAARARAEVLFDVEVVARQFIHAYQSS
ncbi:MAG TPA: glycosyltransferase [Kiritimatiellia bacterium]|nr:glycosyltransferase [Kiritimatiellia bacterium]